MGRTDLEGLPHDRTVCHMKFGTTLPRQDITRRYPEVIVVKHADDVAVLSVTGPFDVRNQLLAQELSDIRSKVTRMQFHRVFQLHDEEHDDDDDNDDKIDRARRSYAPRKGVKGLLRCRAAPVRR